MGSPFILYWLLAPCYDPMVLVAKHVFLVFPDLEFFMLTSNLTSLQPSLQTKVLLFPIPPKQITILKYMIHVVKINQYKSAFFFICFGYLRASIGCNDV